MPFLEKLKEIIKLDFKIDLRQFFHINIVVNKNLPAIQIDDQSKTLTVNLDHSQTKEKITPAIKDAVLKEQMLLMEQSMEQMIDEVKKSESNVDNIKLIEKLKEFIPPADIPIIRAALYLKKKYRDRDPGVQRLKEDIVERYGDRGRKIANLCTAGYFENQILPLLQALQTGEKVDKTRFQEMYDIMILQSGFAVFVHAFMTKDRLKKTLLEKIDSNLKYGMKVLHIHGIGKENVKNIRRTVDEILAEHEDAISKINDDAIGDVLYIKLALNPSLPNSN